jgi:hypothetical protein
VKIDKFEIGKPARLLCYHSPINESLIEIQWKRNNFILNLTEENIEFLDEKKILGFKNFTEIDFGNYSCDLVILNSQILSSFLVLECMI